MAENVDNLVLEQLRLIRQEMGEMRSDMVHVKDGIQAVDAKVDGLSLIVVSLGSHINNLGERAGHIETKLGIDP